MLRHRGVAALLLAVVAAGLVATVVGLTRVEVRTSLDAFLPPGEETLASYRGVGDTFGSEPIVVLLESRRSDDPILGTERLRELVRLEGDLARLPGVGSAYGPATTLNQLAGRAKDLLAELMGRRDAEIALARQRAQERGGSRAAVAGAGEQARLRFDARYGPLLVSGMRGGLPTLGNQRFVDSVIFDSTGAVRPEWRFVVPSREAVAILVRPEGGLDATEAAGLVSAVKRLVDQRRPSGTTATVTGTAVLISALSQRAVDDAPLLGVLAVAGLGLCFATATWVRRSRRWLPLGITLVSLSVVVSVFGWLDRPLTLGMVAFGSVLLGIGSYYPTYALTGASRRTVTVVALASATSLATLCLSPMPLVRDIGLMLALGITVTLALTLAMVARLEVSPVPAAEPGPWAAHRPRPGRARVVLVGACLVAGLGWVQLGSIPVSANVDHFAGGLPALRDARHAEDVLGSAGEVDIVLRGIDTITPETLRWMARVQEIVARRHGDVMRAVLAPSSFFGFLGADPTPGQVDAAARLLPEYLARAVVADDRSQALLTYGVRLDDIDSLEALRQRVVRELPPPPAGYEVEIAGLPLVVVRGQELLSQDRYPASLIGIGAAGLVLLVGLRRRQDAVRAIAAALLATGWGFALLDVTGRGFDPVTIALGALTVAVGAEFAVVRTQAVRQGSRTLVRAVTLMATASAVGYLVLLASGLAAVRAFGAELAVGVLLAHLAAALVVAATDRSSPRAGAATLGRTDALPPPVAAPAGPDEPPTRLLEEHRA